MGKTNFDTNFKRLNVKKFKANALYALRAYSIYDQENKQRKILKKEASSRKIADLIQDGNKDNVSSSIKILKEQGIVKEEGQYYVIDDRLNESHRPLDTEFAKELISKRNSETVMVYLWLHRRLAQKRSIGKRCLFSQKDILEGVFQVNYQNGQWSKKIRSILADLSNSGLIEYSVVAINDTYLRELIAVHEEFSLNKAVEDAEEKAMNGKENVEDYSDDLDESQAVTIATFTTDPNRNNLPMCYDGHKYFREEYDGSKYMLSILKEYPEENYEYFKYYGLLDSV